MSLSTLLTFSWVPGTMDRVRFSTDGQTYTVFLRDVERDNVHSVSDLYMKGRVVLSVTAAHHAQLIGRLALSQRPALVLPQLRR